MLLATCTRLDTGLTLRLEPAIADSEAWYREIVEFELRPLLEEYWMDAPAKAAEETANLLRA